MSVKEIDYLFTSYWVYEKYKVGNKNYPKFRSSQETALRGINFKRCIVHAMSLGKVLQEDAITLAIYKLFFVPKKALLFCSDHISGKGLMAFIHKVFDFSLNLWLQSSCFIYIYIYSSLHCYGRPMAFSILKKELTNQTLKQQWTNTKCWVFPFAQHTAHNQLGLTIIRNLFWITSPMLTSQRVKVHKLQMMIGMVANFNGPLLFYFGGL